MRAYGLIPQDAITLLVVSDRGRDTRTDRTPLKGRVRSGPGWAFGMHRPDKPDMPGQWQMSCQLENVEFP